MEEDIFLYMEEHIYCSFPIFKTKMETLILPPPLSNVVRRYSHCANIWYD